MEFQDIDEDLEPQAAPESSHIKTRKAFSKLAVELDDEDLNAKGVQKLLLAEISRLESAALQVDSLKEKYHQADKERAILKENQKIFAFSEVLYSVSLTVGSALIGLSPSIKSSDVSPWVVGGVGGVLIVGSVLAKVFRR